MKRTEYLSVSSTLAALLFAAATHIPAVAQSDSKTLSGKTGTGKVMTREELRACMKQQDTLAARKTDLEVRQTKVNEERGAIQKETEAIKVEEQALSSRKDDVDKFAARAEALNAKVKDLQARREVFDQGGKSGPNADRERRMLDKEAADIKKEDAQLIADREKLTTGADEAVKKFNARVEAQQRAAESWNERNRQMAKEQQAYEDERVNWIDTCGNRRYKEDDEKAIKAGK